MAQLIDYLKDSVSLGASDIFIVPGAPVTAKADGSLKHLDDMKVLPDRSLELISGAYDMAKRSMDKLINTGDDDFSFAVPALSRFRVNAYKQRGSLAMVIRIVAFDIPDYNERHIPEEILNLAGISHGMVLITGTAGSGKSTTEACIIDRINKTRACHIITLEDPIEFLHRDDKSIVSQREIAIDSQDYLSALRACLRQAPDVIQVGEMRDLETIRAAITAAETGHLLFATLHTKGAVNAIDRIIDTFPAEAQYQIRVQLSMVLDTVVSQMLLPGVNGELIPAFEIMHMNNAIRSMIRDSKTHQINNAIMTGASDGMISMDQYIINLCKAGQISKEVAISHADDPEQMKRKL